MKHLDITHPILSAPLDGGISSPEFVSAICNHECLGSYAGGRVKFSQFEKDIQSIQRQTNNPFIVNLYTPESYTIDPDSVQLAIKALNPIFSKYELTPQLPSNEPQKDKRRFNEKVDLIIKLHVRYCSFSFGIPEADVIKRLKDAGVLLLATANTVAEARLIEEAGFDAVIAQGIEAGGHRGGLLSDSERVKLEDLLPEVVRAISIPVIAAGGIMNKEDIDKYLKMGAEAVQMGTAFLLCDESKASDTYKEMILHLDNKGTILTRTYSGRETRVIPNKFIEQFTDQADGSILPYPAQRSLTKSIQKAAFRAQDIDYMPLWCGMYGYKGKRQPIHDLILSLI